MNLEKTTVTVCETCVKGTAQTMADGDVIVPDSKPDILKILQVDCDTCITDKYIENGKLILSGRASYKVLYIPDGENEKIKSIFTSMDFKQAVDAGGADTDCVILTKPTVERAEFNAVNSRKLRLRAIIHIDYEVSRLKETEITTEITTDITDENCEKQLRTIEFENTVNISEHEFTVKEKLEIQNGENSIGEILKCDVRISEPEYKSVTGKVIIKGILCICVLYSDTDGEIKFTDAEIPFTEVLDTNGVTENSICDIEYCVLDVMFSPEPDIDGDLREIMLDIDISAAIKAVETAEKEVLTDCFIPYCTTDTTVDTLILKGVAERQVSQNTLRDIIEVGQSVPSVRSVYNVVTNAYITKSELERNKIICEGKADVYVLYLTDTPDNPIYGLKKEIPFSYMIDCKNEYEVQECEMKISVKHTSYSLNSGGEIEIRCVLALECMLANEIKLDNICEVATVPRDTRQGIVIYFASRGERVWDIAKRYAVPCATLAEYNKLDDVETTQACKMFIPIG